MGTEKNSHQLGDFIRGRFEFIEEQCKKKRLDIEETKKKVRDETMRLADTDEKKAIAQERLFDGMVLSSSFLPDWLDKIFLEAISVALQGPGTPLYTNTSAKPCIAFEAGRFNAHRQATGVFRVFFGSKEPDEWLKSTFKTIYRQCYGSDAAERLEIKQIDDRHFKVLMDNNGLEKASPVDCSTVIGYLYGGIEFLGAKGIVVTHPICATIPGSTSRTCEYDVTWK